jgi:hypothetical protein
MIAFGSGVLSAECPAAVRRGIDPLLEGAGWFEHRDPARRYRYFLAGLGVAADARTFVAHEKHATRFRGGGTERHVVALATAAARLMRAYSAQVETLRRLRHGGDQYVRVEHVHVNDGGQAVIGNMKSAGSGAAGAPEQSASGVIAPANQDR